MNTKKTYTAPPALNGDPAPTKRPYCPPTVEDIGAWSVLTLVTSIPFDVRNPLFTFDGTDA